MTWGQESNGLAFLNVVLDSLVKETWSKLLLIFSSYKPLFK